MNSKRFKTPSTEPIEVVGEKVPVYKQEDGVCYDRGNVHICNENVCWHLGESGHTCENDGTVTKMENGSLSRKGPSGPAALVSTYSDGELGVRLVNEDGTTTPLSIRVRIATCYSNADGVNLLVLSNDKLYMTHERFGIVRYDNEIDAGLINAELRHLKYHLERVGNTTQLKTNIKTSLVDAINELNERLNGPSRLMGWFKWLVIDEYESSKIRMTDLDISFNYKLQIWQYYSDASESMLVLPDGWQKLNLLTRHLDDLIKVKPKSGTRCGVLEDEKVMIFNGQDWEPTILNQDQVGDEYIAQFIIDTNSIGERCGTLINTPTGWVYTMR